MPAAPAPSRRRRAPRARRRHRRWRGRAPPRRLPAVVRQVGRDQFPTSSPDRLRGPARRRPTSCRTGTSACPHRGRLRRRDRGGPPGDHRALQRGGRAHPVDAQRQAGRHRGNGDFDFTREDFHHFAVAHPTRVGRGECEFQVHRRVVRRGDEAAGRLVGAGDRVFVAGDGAVLEVEFPVRRQRLRQRAEFVPVGVGGDRFVGDRLPDRPFEAAGRSLDFGLRRPQIPRVRAFRSATETWLKSSLTRTSR